MKYAINKGNTSCRILDGEAIIVNLKNSYYYTLNDTGTFIWELLAERKLALEELTISVARRYEKDEKEIVDDVANILKYLAKENLIEKIKPCKKELAATIATKKTSATGKKQAKTYRPPKLTKFAKLEKIIRAAL
jgi:hypothetical protein